MEIFKSALDETKGDDLQEILWKTSQNSETWLERRSNFTSSLALMSMAGYILGLGDRHPSNLMVMRASGRIIHIDFGDCFEVAALRDRLPEKIPFRLVVHDSVECCCFDPLLHACLHVCTPHRLTRMLVNAMEVRALEGRFRSMCERVLQLLRWNRDAVIATLETFIYDPLTAWQLLGEEHRKLGRILKASAPSSLNSKTSRNSKASKTSKVSAGKPSLRHQENGIASSRNSKTQKLVGGRWSFRIFGAHCSKCAKSKSQAPFDRTKQLQNGRSDEILFNEYCRQTNETTDTTTSRDPSETSSHRRFVIQGLKGKRLRRNLRRNYRNLARSRRRSLSSQSSGNSEWENCSGLGQTDTQLR